MIIQTITFKSNLSEEEAMKIAKERVPQFRQLPGLIQKYYIRLDQPNTFRGLYIWDSKESMLNYKQSDLAASIPKAYQIVEPPTIEITEVMFPLRD